MPKVSIRGNQLTLPDELRQALTTAEDDSLEAEEVVEGILLRRSPSARRKAGLPICARHNPVSGISAHCHARVLRKKSSVLPMSSMPKSSRNGLSAIKNETGCLRHNRSHKRLH
jgi:bifunctional DNA-binding transcriptional regulator/antitoxin component of YhaV-PrlF toxin-antitoxin module